MDTTNLGTHTRAASATPHWSSIGLDLDGIHRYHLLTLTCCCSLFPALMFHELAPCWWSKRQYAIAVHSLVELPLVGPPSSLLPPPSSQTAFMAFSDHKHHGGARVTTTRRDKDRSQPSLTVNHSMAVVISIGRSLIKTDDKARLM